MEGILQYSGVLLKLILAQKWESKSLRFIDPCLLDPVCVSIRPSFLFIDVSVIGLSERPITETSINKKDGLIETQTGSTCLHGSMAHRPFAHMGRLYVLKPISHQLATSCDVLATNNFRHTRQCIAMHRTTSSVHCYSPVHRKT